MAILTPLSTKGSQIVDAAGSPILLRGLAWFGMETELHVPHGLWNRDYKQMLAQIKGLGYNIIRLPYSVQALRSSNISGVDFSIGSNSDLNGKTPLQVMDLIIQEAGQQGLMIMLDSHRLNDSSIPELWYGDGFTEADWIDTWILLANRYKNQSNVVAADLKNEPHGRASWGTGDLATDWRLAAERCGNAIQAVNPNWLMVIEGVVSNVPNQQLPGHWWGGNLEGVKNFPVRLNVPNKVVYSPHEYGPGVFNQPWFSEPGFPQNLRRRWQIGFYYIAEAEIAPVLIGEFGGREVDANSKEGIWQRALVEFIKETNLHFTYWCWNPNSGDTGGILLDDWRTIDAAKQALLSTLLNGAMLPPAPQLPAPQPPAPQPPAPQPPAPQPPVPQPPVPQPPDGDGKAQLAVEAIIESDWDSGFCVRFRITNWGNASTKDWQLSFNLTDATIAQVWNGSFVASSSDYTVTVPDWAKVIPPGQTFESIGFCAQKQGNNYKPTQVLATAL